MLTALGGFLWGKRAVAMARPEYAPLSIDQKRQLETLSSADGMSIPCGITIKDGTLIDRAYVAPAERWFEHWGVWPENDPGKASVDIRQVVRIEDSAARLPTRLAEKLYAAGESGMGYTIFTVVFRDGTRQAFGSGGALDFITYPAGQSRSSVADVLPHVGRDDPGLRPCPNFTWCLYNES